MGSTHNPRSTAERSVKHISSTRKRAGGERKQVHTNLTTQRAGTGSPNKSTLDAGCRGEACGAETSAHKPQEAEGGPQKPSQEPQDP